MTTASIPEHGFTVEDKTVDGRDGPIPVRDYRPTTPSVRTPFLWVHGGGFSSGDLEMTESDATARALAAAGIRVRTIQYRLAPRASLFKDPELGAHPGRYPAALHDVVDVARALMAESGGPISVGGGSAGANLAAGAVLSLRDEGATLPRAVVLAYGTLHSVLPPGDDVEGELRGVLAKWAFNPKMVWRMNVNYVGDPDLLVPGYAFPGGADLHDFPPTLVADAANDRLRRSGHAFAAELRSGGTEVREVVLSGTHAYLNAPKKAGFKQGVVEITNWLLEHD